MARSVGKMIEEYADYADKAGKDYIPIRAGVTRKTVMATTEFKCGKIKELTSGGKLVYGKHEIICTDTKNKVKAMQHEQLDL